jgi:hypothetical protein
MKKKDIQRIEEFCSQRKDSFVKPSWISYKSNRARILLDCIFKWLFYSILRIKKLW